MKVILEIARGDSIEELQGAGVIVPATFYCADHSPISGYTVVGGTEVDCEVDYDKNEVRFAGYVMRYNAYGFGHGQRPIFRKSLSGCFLIEEVFFG